MKHDFLLDYRATDSEAEVFWDLPEYADKDSIYTILIAGKKAGETLKTHFTLKDLLPESESKVEILFEGSKSLGIVTVCTGPVKKKLDVTRPPYNAVGDGKTLNTAALQKALDDCDRDSSVYIPEGTFLTGALNMHSGTELFVSEKAL